jgi:hypothetical protein
MVAVTVTEDERVGAFQLDPEDLRVAPERVVAAAVEEDVRPVGLDPCRQTPLRPQPGSASLVLDEKRDADRAGRGPASG